MSVSCLKIEILFACYWSPDPKAAMGERWNSCAGRDARKWLIDLDLISETNGIKPRGIAWVNEILVTPLPTQKWVIER